MEGGVVEEGRALADSEGEVVVEEEEEEEDGNEEGVEEVEVDGEVEEEVEVRVEEGVCRYAPALFSKGLLQRIWHISSSF